MRSCVAGVCVLVAVSAVRLAAGFEMTLLHVNDIHVKMEETNKYSSTCKPRDRGRTTLLQLAVNFDTFRVQWLIHF